MNRLILDAQRLEDYRKSRNWTPTDLAAELGISPTGLYRLIKGRTSPSAKVIARLAAFKNVQIPFCKMEVR